MNGWWAAAFTVGGIMIGFGVGVMYMAVTLTC